VVSEVAAAGPVATGSAGFAASVSPATATSSGASVPRGGSSVCGAGNRLSRSARLVNWLGVIVLRLRYVLEN
jgi:hypothetical protein